ncbi:nitric oxide reductase activation protein NorD [Nocardia sp. BMG111209]|uniref:nitric oxide reductase activation protein NorD n=1 Tax=Nocardia sp. BMG111209 TaxID=1160137 RepID=UPI00037D3513|nr:VWA domain-containing protein [Nocardia sp. BMG111209]
MADDEMGRLAMLASALAGRTVTVAALPAGEPAWTDGRTVYLDATAEPRERLEALAVQASLLAGGGLAPDIVRRLAHRRTLTRRYLAIEGRRALLANAWLPPGALGALPAGTCTAATPAESLAAAAGRSPIADPPAAFGVIRPAALLAAGRAGGQAGDAAHVPRRRSGAELPGPDEDSAEDHATSDPFSSPVGGAGALGALLARLTSATRRLSGGGPPGADAPTHARRSATRGAGAVVSTAAAVGADDARPGASGARYPEWDCHRGHYRQAWCTVIEIEAPRTESAPAAPDTRALRTSLARLGLGFTHRRRQPQGDDIDVDAAVAMRVETAAGSTPDEAVYVANLRRRHDLSVLILLDVSGSAAEAGTAGRTVHEQQREAAAALAGALHELGNRVAVFAYSSQGRSAVHLTPIKRFDDRLDAAATARLHGVRPGAYSRLGAAIRHGTAILRERSGTPRRLLVVLSDGLAYDHGYERAYGAADARKALAEAGNEGIGCLCLTIGAATDAEALRQVFGAAAHATIDRPDRLRGLAGPLLRLALDRADIRRRRPA